MPACLIPDPCAHTPRGSEEGNRHSPTGVEILTGVTQRMVALRRARTLGMV